MDSASQIAHSIFQAVHFHHQLASIGFECPISSRIVVKSATTPIPVYLFLFSPLIFSSIYEVEIAKKVFMRKLRPTKTHLPCESKYNVRLGIVEIKEVVRVVGQSIDCFRRFNVSSIGKHEDFFFDRLRSTTIQSELRIVAVIREFGSFFEGSVLQHR